jgi:hypothetical protein
MFFHLDPFPELQQLDLSHGEEAVIRREASEVSMAAEKQRCVIAPLCLFLPSWVQPLLYLSDAVGVNE